MADNIILSWDAVIEDDGTGGYEPLEEGDYDFEVADFKRTFAKDNTTPVLELSIKVGDTTIRDWIHFKKSTEWKISQFLICIGQKKHGEPTKVDFDHLIGCKGRCHVTGRTYTKQNGTEGRGNNIGNYLEPAAPSMKW